MEQEWVWLLGKSLVTVGIGAIMGFVILYLSIRCFVYLDNTYKKAKAEIESDTKTDDILSEK